jgi:OFA family oxalate/formate antiporter-like MFS transporter
MTDSTAPSGNRWLIAAMGTLLQLCLGTVYAWSYFQNPLMTQYDWSNAQVAWVFCIAICFLGIAAAWGGANLARFGPRKLAVTGALLFGIGYLVAAFALLAGSLPFLYLGYGVIGGIGLGLGYVTPVATVAKWFPDRKGLVTGMVVMGFGFGALFMSKVLAPAIVDYVGSREISKSAPFPIGGYSMVFTYLGIFLLVVSVFAASFLKNPPAGWTPARWTPPAPKSGAAAIDDTVTAGAALGSARFAMMWLVFFCNIAAGIAIISFQSPLMQDLYRRLDPTLSAATLAAYGATLIAVSSLFNGAGRFFWGAVSDRLGRVQTFRLMLATEVLAFIALIFTTSPLVFGALICWILLCYGGGFGTMPSFVLDVFGPRLMAVVYGVILTAWSAAGIAGPQLFAGIKDRLPLDTAGAWSFFIAACILSLGLATSLLGLSNSPFRRKAPAAAVAPAGD